MNEKAIRLRNNRKQVYDSSKNCMEASMHVRAYACVEARGVRSDWDTISNNYRAQTLWLSVVGSWLDVVVAFPLTAAGYQPSTRGTSFTHSVIVIVIVIIMIRVF